MDLPELWKALISEQYDLVDHMMYCGANINEPKKIYSDYVVTLLHYAVLKPSVVQCIRFLMNIKFFIITFLMNTP